MWGSSWGASSSSSSPSTPRPRSLAQLAASGRLVSFPSPGSPTPNIHILGVLPCSTISEDEARALVAAVAPTHLYIDVTHEYLKLLTEAPPSKADAPPPESTPPFSWRTGAGLFGSIILRNDVADNTMLGLMGAEKWGAFKAGLEAAGVGSKAGKTPPALLTYPFDMDYNNGELLDRPGHVVALLFGDASFNSTTVHAIVGGGPSLTAGEPADAEFAARLPPSTGYFTRADVTQLRKDFQDAVNKALLRKPGGGGWDVEADLAAREGAAREAGNLELAAAFGSAAGRSEVQAQAVAHTLQAAGGEAGAVVVGLVNLGTLESLKRNWAESAPPTTLVPPYAAWQRAAGVALPTVLGGGLAWGVWKLGRRLPRTTAVGVLGLAAAGGGFLYNIAYSDLMRYGGAVRAGLARPRVSSSLARVGPK